MLQNVPSVVTTVVSSKSVMFNPHPFSSLSFTPTALVATIAFFLFVFFRQGKRQKRLNLTMQNIRQILKMKPGDLELLIIYDAKTGKRLYPSVSTSRSKKRYWWTSI